MSTPVVDFKQIDDDLYWDNVRGDFVFAPSDNQHILDILRSFPGWWKNSPSTGVGIAINLKGKVNISSIENQVKLQLEADNYQVNRPSIKLDSNGNMTVIPNASRLQ